MPIILSHLVSHQPLARTPPDLLQSFLWVSLFGGGGGIEMHSSSKHVFLVIGWVEWILTG